MSRFAPALRRVARELDLPRTVRSAILAELASDLEAVFEHHRARGLGVEQAALRAEEQVIGSAEVLRRLSRLHRGSWREWSADIGARLGGGVDLVLLVLGVLPILVFVGIAVVGALTTGPTSPLVWPISAIGTLLIAVIPAELIRLVRGGPARPHRLQLLLALAALAPVLGLLALVHGAYDIASTLGATPAALDSAITAFDSATAAVAGLSTGDLIGESYYAGQTQRFLALIVIRDGTALLIALLLAIAGGLSWFILLNRAAEQVAREVDRVLEGESEGGPDTAAPPRGAPEYQPVGSESKIIPLARGRRA